MRSITGREAFMMYLLVQGLVRSGSVYEALVLGKRRKNHRDPQGHTTCTGLHFAKALV